MLIAALINCILVIVVVGIHHESMYLLTRLLPNTPFNHRVRVLLGVLGALIAHVLEVGVFGVAYYALHKRDGWGELKGNFDGSFFDSVYFSFTTYTTLGFGDIEPLGDIRLLVGIEALTGLVLITWSASFLFIEMQRYWKVKK